MNGRGASRKVIVAALLCATGSYGCSSQYRPQRSPRVAVVMQGGQLAYERDGESKSIGFFGSGLVETVSADPQAREAAETYQTRTTIGAVLVVLGTACLLGGFYLAVDNIDRQPQDRSSGRNAGEAGLLACGAGGLIAGSVLLLTAQPYQFDAVNIYNDNIERRRMWIGPPPWAAPVPAPVRPAPATPVLPPPPAPAVPADAGPGG